MKGIRGGGSAGQGAADILPSPVSPSQSRTAPAEEEFALPHRLARVLFLMTQVGYLAMYGAALYYAESLEQTLARVLPIPAGLGMLFLIVSAMWGMVARVDLLCSVGFRHPAAGEKFHRLFPLLFLLDECWAASPLLLVSKIGPGLALACVAVLAYLPFSQRTLIRSIHPNSFGPAPKDAPASH